MSQKEIEVDYAYGTVIKASLPTTTRSDHVTLQYWMRHMPTRQQLVALCLVWQAPIEVVLINKVFISPTDFIVHLKAAPVFTYVNIPDHYIDIAVEEKCTFGKMVLTPHGDLAHAAHWYKGVREVVCPHHDVRYYYSRYQSEVTA